MLSETNDFNLIFGLSWYFSFQKKILYILMDHSDSDICDLVSSHPSRHKSQKELTSIIRYLFENPKVFMI